MPDLILSPSTARLFLISSLQNSLMCTKTCVILFLRTVALYPELLDPQDTQMLPRALPSYILRLLLQHPLLPIPFLRQGFMRRQIVLLLSWTRQFPQNPQRLELLLPQFLKPILYPIFRTFRLPYSFRAMRMALFVSALLSLKAALLQLLLRMRLLFLHLRLFTLLKQLTLLPLILLFTMFLLPKSLLKFLLPRQISSSIA